MGNMFRCTLASGGALVLTVTCDSAFAGQTITCTDGTTTLTQICPSASPYSVEFRIPNAGIWTISSGTTSTSITIPSFAELHDIPNGSTVTPVGNIQTWLHCANIWDKNYTSISQVLADASILQALISSNNAVDYMVRSTTWASSVAADSGAMSYISLNDYCANSLLANSTWLNAICNSNYFENILNVKVPTMTSNTSPSGTAFASSAFSVNQAAYKAFDGDNSSRWGSLANQYSNAYVGYSFENPLKIYKCEFKLLLSSVSNINSNNITITLQGSNNGSDYTDIATTTGTGSSFTNSRNVIIQDPVQYSYYRLKFSTWLYNSGDGNHYACCYDLQFYGRA